MHLTELKIKPITELIDTAREMGLENVGRSRKQEVIAAIVRKLAKNGEDIYGDGTLEILQDGFGFCAPQTVLTLQDLMISTYLRVRLDASIYAPATVSLEKSDRQKTASVTLLCLKSMRSTSVK